MSTPLARQMETVAELEEVRNLARKLAQALADEAKHHGDTSMSEFTLEVLAEARIALDPACAKSTVQELTELVKNETNYHTCDVFQRKPHSMVHLVFGYKDKVYSGVGFSVYLVIPPDKWNPEAGSDFAFNRAVEDIVGQIMVDNDQEST